MDRFLICQICGEKLSFNPFCTCSLGEHLIKKHPDVDMTHFVMDDISLCDCDDDSAAGSFSGLDGQQLGLEGKKSEMKEERSKSGVFKTTVETWKPGPQRVTCPSCGIEDRPCIRKQRNKVAYTQLGAMCMVSCWPICFLPFLMPQSSAVHLYCRHCGALLGEYNRQNGTLKVAPVTSKKGLHVPSNLC